MPNFCTSSFSLSARFLKLSNSAAVRSRRSCVSLRRSFVSRARLNDSSSCASSWAIFFCIASASGGVETSSSSSTPFTSSTAASGGTCASSGIAMGRVM